jgi:ABC-type lipoprotein release transport system permease subunit
MTSFIAACGSGRSTSFIPAVPAAWSVTTIAFMIIFSSVICLFAEYVPALKSPFAAGRSGQMS